MRIPFCWENSNPIMSWTYVTESFGLPASPKSTLGWQIYVSFTSVGVYAMQEESRFD
jgi:hypothetical protein